MFIFSRARTAATLNVPSALVDFWIEEGVIREPIAAGRVLAMKQRREDVERRALELERHERATVPA